MLLYSLWKQREVSTLIAVEKDKKNENFGHLFIVNDGQVSLNDIKDCDKFVE